MFLLGELISHSDILVVTQILDGGGARGQNLRSKILTTLPLKL